MWTFQVGECDSLKLMAPSPSTRTLKLPRSARRIAPKALRAKSARVAAATRKGSRSPAKKTRTLVEWADYAERRLHRALVAARAIPKLRKHGPRVSVEQWKVTVRLVGSAEMTRLNREYRDLAYATDILSFTNPEIFFKSGILGELVICLPTCRRQAKEQGHSVEDELEVMLVHGLLHLLGFDHEIGPKQAREMADWEAKLGRKAGLIARSRSGT
jgi:rRNA maturation RNase YbeY